MSAIPPDAGRRGRRRRSTAGRPVTRAMPLAAKSAPAREAARLADARVAREASEGRRRRWDTHGCSADALAFEKADGQLRAGHVHSLFGSSVDRRGGELKGKPRRRLLAGRKRRPNPARSVRASRTTHTTTTTTRLTKALQMRFMGVPRDFGYPEDGNGFGAYDFRNSMSRDFDREGPAGQKHLRRSLPASAARCRALIQNPRCATVSSRPIFVFTFNHTEEGSCPHRNTRFSAAAPRGGNGIRPDGRKIRRAGSDLHLRRPQDRTLQRPGES